MNELAKYSYFHRPIECSKCGQKYRYFIMVQRASRLYQMLSCEIDLINKKSFILITF